MIYLFILIFIYYEIYSLIPHLLRTFLRHLCIPHSLINFHHLRTPYSLLGSLEHSVPVSVQMSMSMPMPMSMPMSMPMPMPMMVVWHNYKFIYNNNCQNSKNLYHVAQLMIDLMLILLNIELFCFLN